MAKIANLPLAVEYSYYDGMTTKNGYEQRFDVTSIWIIKFADKSKPVQIYSQHISNQANGTRTRFTKSFALLQIQAYRISCPRQCCCQ